MCLARCELPVNPGELVVLAVDVVVATLGSADLVVVRDDEVDRGDRAPGRVLVQVAGSCQTRGKLAQGCSLAAPEVAHSVAELAVPLGPQRREVADLVAAIAEVPRLGNELDLGDHRILLN